LVGAVLSVRGVFSRFDRELRRNEELRVLAPAET
jgi:hypothetical protein